MSRAVEEYTRLPGRARNLLGSSRLWLGPDHVLAVEGRGYSESYRRFYYRDIQALVTCRTGRWLVTSGTLGLLLALAAGGFFSIPAPGRVFWAVPGGIFLLLFLADVLSGPTCVCRIMTAAQTTGLPSLRRLRKARRAVAKIRERIEAAQGPWTGLPIIDAAAPRPEPVAIPAASSAAPPPPRPAATVRRDNGRLHQVLFWSLFADSALTVVAVTARQNAVYGAAEVLLLVELGLTIAAIVKQRRTDMPRGVRSVVWATLAYLCVSVAMTMLMSWIAAFRALAIRAGAPPTLEAGRSLALDVFGVAAPLLLGMAGQLSLRRFLHDREETDLSLFGRL